ncbi:MAG TPA: LamG-like jellyroll fold domain-containing protein, partial [Gemmatimonadaceae bacterium]|nr:LamG-like jellyroll fold domain-containing protein [Gemmatimonadaceae bacterium]
MGSGFYRSLALSSLWIAVALGPTPSLAAPAALAPTANFGPYNVEFLEGGIGLSRALSADATPLGAGAPWSMSGWARIGRCQSGDVILAGIGDTAHGEWRGIVLADGALSLIVGPSTTVHATTVLDEDRWYAIAAVFDGAVAHLYLDGREIAAHTAATLRVPGRIELAPAAAALGGRPHFGGSLAQWTLQPTALSAAAVESLARARPDFSLITFDSVGVGWPWQEHAWRGLQEPQDAWTLPRAKSPPGAPVAEPVVESNALEPRAPGLWTLEAWRLRAAPGLDAGGARLSQPDYDDAGWYSAIVPGTVLTTLIARGVYPDPNYGLNNLAIPDSLSRQDYWYRSVFDAPPSLTGKELTLTFKGINYAADVWLNGA